MINSTTITVEVTDIFSTCKYLTKKQTEIMKAIVFKLE